MKKLSAFKINLFGILLLLTAIIITLVLSFNKLTKKSFYSESGTENVQGINANVQITRDDFGVPHIEASVEGDMYFALGYMHARDRLWQMDISRRVAQGRLSEIFGKDLLKYDVLFRTIGIDNYAESFYHDLSDKSREILKSYCDGVNAFIDANNKKLPLEFDVLNYKPEPWKPEHSIMIIRLMGWELNLSWYTDFTFGEIINKFGFDRAKDFFPNYPEDAPFIVKTDKKSKPSDSTKKVSADNLEKNYSKLAELGKDYYDLARGYRRLFNIEGTHIGSNAWVVSGKKSENRKPLLANDPHLVLSAPSKWYEVVLSNTQTGIKTCGFSIAGIPGIAIGCNNFISWGITNLMNDDADFYILKKDSADLTKYVYKGVSYVPDSTVEGIKIKDIKDENFITIRHTKLGPVISDLESTGFKSNHGFRVNRDELLTFRWTGFEFSDEIRCFYDLNNAKNWNDFKNAIKNFNLPASNFVYSDVEGNIGYHAAGKVPLRKNMVNEFSGMYPSNGEVEWSGYVNFDDLPQAFNPKEEYIITANNKPDRDLKYYISNLYEPPYRAERIEMLLKARNNFTAEEFKLIQNDVYSLQAKEFCAYLFDAYRDSLKSSQEEREVIKLLKNWDYEMKAFNPAAMIFAEFEIYLYRNLFESKLGKELFENYVFLKNIPVRTVSKLLRESSSWLFDITGSENKIEKRNEVLRKSLKDALESIKAGSGENDFRKWRWGDVHKVLIRHPLGSVPALSQMVNIGPDEISGNGTTIANAEYSFFSALEKKDFECYLGASMRFIVDMSDLSSYQSVLPSGQSGQPQHSNYKDQNRLWLHGEYKTVLRDNERIKSSNRKVILLIPS
ncbi:penicillin acylase family protein [bacterium]|nr:MAG: penicillin acylase family protein [bacterium]